MFIDIFENNIEKELEKVPNMKSVKQYSFYNYGVYVFCSLVMNFGDN